MSDGTKLADILARKKAARAAKEGLSSQDGGLGRSQSGSPSTVARGRSTAFSNPSDEDDDEEAKLCVTLGGSSTVGALEQFERNRLGVVEVSMADLELEADKIAQGGLGLLYRGVWRGCTVAVKKPVDPRAAADATLRADFHREVDLLSVVRHPNIVLLMGACLRPSHLCMVFEWCWGGSLKGLIYSRADVPKEQKLKICTGVAAALTFLHSCSPAIIHRDIKPENVLLDEGYSIPKLCDFGLSIHVSEAAETRAGSGTPMYMSPELYRGECCSLASDVYAFGVTLWEVFARETPFGGMDIADMKEKVVTGERPTIPLTCPRHIGQLVKECWVGNAEKRPNMSEVHWTLKNMARPNSPLA